MAIVKVLSRHSPSYASLIRYILRGADKDVPEVFTQNIRSNDEEGYAREFMENVAFRLQGRSDQVYLFHEIVSFNSSENDASLTREVTADLASEYMRLRGDTGVTLGAVHRDRDHVHIHFCVSALHFRTGKSFGLSKPQLFRLKSRFQEYHRNRYPELSKSFPAHGKGGRYVSPREWQARHREQVISPVTECFVKATSQQHFLELLRGTGLHHYKRGGKPTGIEHGGRKFRFSQLLEGAKFSDLPVETKEEDKVLDEIRAIRGRARERGDLERQI
ncbi:MAG: relaxase/mobilization nuclease domain-containing protein [Mucilaginibacter sp.]|uniref:relaxase/mobilization nuclease domain-containing protein n=1 Tax=Mucilaginibacter sp. TaxID=1882438 RepID=UPI003265CC00